VARRLPVFGISLVLTFSLLSCGRAEKIKEPSVTGSFYPAQEQVLSDMVSGFINNADPAAVDGPIFTIISPHAGYGYSGQVAGFGYKLIKDKPYKTVIILGTGHHHAFSGASVYPDGFFETPLGIIAVDKDFTSSLLGKVDEVIFDPAAFEGEHSLEVQLPFLQKSLTDFKIVPIILGDCSLETCRKIAGLLKDAIGERKDVLLVSSTDMYHGYDYDEASAVDKVTLSAIEKMDAEGLYYGLRDGKMQACGGFGVVTALILSKELGHNKAKLLKYTNSAEVTGNKKKGVWTVGYASVAIDSAAGGAGKSKEKNMLNSTQRKKLLEIARSSIEEYLKSGKKIELGENDPLLKEKMGAFVTLNEDGHLRGCIGSLVGKEPLYLTVRDMAIEAATDDPRFREVSLPEMHNIEIEISVLSPMEKIDSPDQIIMGTHGVLIRKGFRSGVFLPQVATETGWSKEEFMSELCTQKAGLPADAWKDKSTDIYIFTAEVFSEKSNRE
jgi:AmmeMemoRadiSam system protein B/AmmeMemoRadiSam system protein A